MADFKKAVEAQEAKIREDHEDLRILMEELTEFRRGSSRRARLEERIASRKAELQIRLKKSRERFLEQEARIYDAVYREIVEEVARSAKRQGIRMVIRRATEKDKLAPQKEMDKVDPNSVLARINRPVVYHEEELDITLPVLAALNRKATRPQNRQQKKSDRPTDTDR
jgi:Skp family chaperone for outer membrane proteins